MGVTANSVWNNCLAFIKDNIQPQAFKTWFLPIKPVKLQDNALSIQVPSKFFYEWLEEHYVKLLKEAIQITNKGGLILASTNSANFSMMAFSDFVAKAFKELKGKYKVEESFFLPKDFRVNEKFREFFVSATLCFIGCIWTSFLN